MGKLTVRNNWEYLEWSFNGERVDATLITEIVCGDRVFKVEPYTRRKTYNDMGHSYNASSIDLMVIYEIAGGIPVKFSLYETPLLLNSVTGLTKGGEDV